MPIVSQSKCRQIFLQNKLPRSRVHPSWLCVGGVKDKDTCRGDGGSPHVCFTGTLALLVSPLSHLRNH